MSDQIELVPQNDPIWKDVTNDEVNDEVNDKIKIKQFDIQQNKTIKPKIIKEVSKNDKHSIVGSFVIHKKIDHQSKKSYIKFCQRKNGKILIAKIIHETVYRLRTSTDNPDKEAYILNKANALHGYYKICQPGNEYDLYLIQDEVKGKIIYDDWTNSKHSLTQKLNEIEKVVNVIDNFHKTFKASHGDITDKNIIKQSNGSYKLIDFGESEDLNEKPHRRYYDFCKIFSIIKNTDFLPKNAYEKLSSYVNGYDINEVKDRLLNGLKEMKKMNL